jgi:hypothetical protein
MGDEDGARRLAEAVREACLHAAQEAYENAGISGLCEEGRWECAVGAIRGLDVELLLRAIVAHKEGDA